MPPPTTSTDGRLWPAGRAGRIRRTALSIALGGGLALGVAGLAQAADNPAPTGSTPPSAEAGTPPAPRGPGKHRPHLDGTVKSISSSRIVIVDRDGFTRQINITSTPSGVKVGTAVHAEGSVNADGVSLDATTVGVAPTPPQRPAPGKGGKPGPPKHDGPGAANGKPAAPSGEAAPQSGEAVPPSAATPPPAPADSSAPAPATPPSSPTTGS